MKMSFRKVIIIGAALFSLPAFAIIDNNAPIVKLRDITNGGCTEAGLNIDNCFTDITSLSNWVSGVRRPNASTPLVVDIGPGKFVGAFGCNSLDYPGYVTLRGAGMKNTIIEAPQSPVSTNKCVQMRFSDMTLRNTGNLFGVQNLGGSTFWDNVEIDGFGYAWFDSPSACGVNYIPGSHYWFGSKITTRSAAGSSTAYFNACDVSYFFGSEITANATVSGTLVRTITAVGGKVHVYGSVIKALSGSGISTSSMYAALATGKGEIHIHGTGIDAISADGNSLYVLSANSGGEIHANGSAYNLKTGVGGSISRISNSGGHIHAPYLWEHVPNTDGDINTIDTNFSSANGADQTTVTSGTNDGHPHVAVYSTACPTTARWYDQVDKVCRSQ
ncbi:MAG: hypothetical protein HYZ31_00290 [Gammaproteobacteria bacterium]|nr:hypothetical protein [Gammaproteobacteria bacterium]